MMGMMGIYGQWDDVPSYMQNMMQNYYFGSPVLWQFDSLLNLIRSVLIIILLVALVRWVWRKGDKSK